MLEIKPVLDYLFVAETYNGTIFKQNKHDISTLDPQKRNCYYDLMQIGNPVKKFSLIGKGHIFSVDLTDGHFEMDGKYIQTKLPPKKAELELIYYHVVQQSIVIETDGFEKDEKVQQPKRRYYIGWRCTQDNGFGKPKTYKFELGVD